MRTPRWCPARSTTGSAPTPDRAHPRRALTPGLLGLALTFGLAALPGLEDRLWLLALPLGLGYGAFIAGWNGLVGRVVDWRDVHVVRKPGLYGLAQAPSGQNYAIVDGRLVRIDSRTAKVLSIIRTVDAILD